jgi:hypothetical protein
MGQLKGQFQVLLGQTIASLSRVALSQGDDVSPLLDTVLLTLGDRRKFELLVEQNTVKFEEILLPQNLFASFELEPDEQFVIDPSMDKMLERPQTIASLTEIWAGEPEHEFLIAISFWNPEQHHILSICTEGDEAEIMNLAAIRQRLDDTMFSYGRLSQQFYSSKADTIAVA